MKPHTVSQAQHNATWPTPNRNTRSVCPDCGHPGPHWNLGRGWLECANDYRTRITRNTWRPCGATWQLPLPIRPEDPTTERVVEILDRHTDIGVIDARDGGTVLDWETT